MPPSRARRSRVAHSAARPAGSTRTAPQRRRDRSEYRDHDERHGGRHVGGRIGWRDADERRAPSLANDELDDVQRAGAERDPQAELPCTLADDERERQRPVW